MDLTMAPKRGRGPAVVAMLAMLASGTVLLGQTAQPAVVTVLRPARVFDGGEMHEAWGCQDPRRPNRCSGTCGFGHRTRCAHRRSADGDADAGSHRRTLAHSFMRTTRRAGRSSAARRRCASSRAGGESSQATLAAGFTTVRDLGTEGAGYADVELREAVSRGIVPGPRILAATRAIVATGSYQQKASRWSFAYRRAPKRPTASTV